MRPLIAIAAMRSPQVNGLRRHGYVASQRVVDAVYRAGGEPVILPPVDPGQRPRLDLYRAVVLPGGRDLDPEIYGSSGEVHPDHGPYDPIHDQVDLNLARNLIEAQIPTLAICRGMQVINVALGGTLCSDLPATAVEHGHGFHPVELEPDSMLAHVMASTAPNVSTCHHQAVERLGHGLKATGHAADGCIEAVEHQTAPLLAVQWHPEDDADVSAVEQALFEALLEPARWRTSLSPNGVR